MKKLLFTIFSFVITVTLVAQSPDLVIQSEAGKLYLNHIVTAKENFYSIGRLYNISPKEIAPLNGLTLTSGLEVGQSLKIPLSAGNFVQQGTAGADEVFVPLYHIVEEKEGLFRIGQNFNKVSVNDIKKWNSLSSENLEKGQQLVVGFLKVKKSQSALAVNGLKKTGDPATTSPPVVSNTPVSGNATNTPTTATPNTTTTQNTVSSSAQADGNGFFKELYRQQSTSNDGFRSTTGSGAIFKSTSGWQDAKYYVLMNNITPGTIVRITNPVNSRTIFAKVLGELPPGKENEGLLIRVSNAGAAELKVNEKEAKFSAEVSYAKS
ncbi:MAG: LysM peptidoglycan-binding domain-containing protein [Chitinophagaceae bacterium]|nr:LysM peptidoglycan-binding domain-containing protein [Chitinophagaceae bacterium]